MNSVKGSRLNILVDLKPALDGFAGIPQETRLLFRGLSSLSGVSVEGLIQHGGKHLRAGLRRGDNRLSPDARINRLSRVVVSLVAKPYSGKIGKIYHGVERWISGISLRLKTFLGISIKLSIFDSLSFEDFVWRTFFSKTLSSNDFQSVTAARFRIIENSRMAFHQSGLGALGYPTFGRYPKLATRGYSAFIAQTPFPGRVSPGTKLIIRYHDAVPLLMPHTISDSSVHQASHYHALKENVRSGAWFCCISEATRRDLVSIFPEAEAQSVVIHNAVSDAYYNEPYDNSLVVEILNIRRRRVNSVLQPDIRPFEPLDVVNPVRYLLMVSTLEPRKNHETLIEAWEKLRVGSFPGLKLVFVGSLGWDSAQLLKRISPWIDRGEIFWFSEVPTRELRSLYVNAQATICPGYFEGFDYSGIEAMKCGCCVAASDIDVHHEIYGDAALYFNPYDVDETASVIARLVGSGAEETRTFLVNAGVEVSARYGLDVVLPQWQAFLKRALSPAEFRVQSNEP